MAVANYTPQQFAAILTEFFDGEDHDMVIHNLALVQGWLARGDGAAIYRNHDLSHPNVGHPKVVSFGSAEAQLEIADGHDLPITLPDTDRDINWRYQLEGFFRIPGVRFGLTGENKVIVEFAPTKLAPVYLSDPDRRLVLLAVGFFSSKPGSSPDTQAISDLVERLAENVDGGVESFHEGQAAFARVKEEIEGQEGGD